MKKKNMLPKENKFANFLDFSTFTKLNESSEDVNSDLTMEFVSSEPSVRPAEPIVKPETKPMRPQPGRINRPSVEPTPKALKKATEQDIIDRANQIVNSKNDKNENY